jgi:glutamate synthase domain-containing protein 2
MVRNFLLISIGVFALLAGVASVWPPVLWSLTILLPLFLLGVFDSLQTRHAVKRNFPVIGHFRYLLEMIRPEINQYFVESDLDGRPFGRDQRSIAYQRSKNVTETLPFGTQRNVYADGYEWINHSFAARHPQGDAPRRLIGAKQCEQPYAASTLNISAMSYGSLSKAAIEALNGGAKIGGFYHNTGEGGVSPYHLGPGGDLVWQIGTGYFGCRNQDGSFNSDRFIESASHKNVKMIEVKLSQGAKPGHGGILPAAKITQEIADIRGVVLGEDIISPPAHTAFSSPQEMLDFLDQLRELSGGKPVGIKLCIGNPAEFLGLCMAMARSGQYPDFLAIDGGEGGTGAAPLEFSDSMGAPLTEGLILAHNALVGFNLREHITIIASGKIISGFHMAARLAAGADICNSARGFMFALGCIQARRCNTNHCPVGIATQNPGLVRGLEVSDKAERVAAYHQNSMDAFRELLGAAGLDHPDELTPWHIHRRVDQTQVLSYGKIFEPLDPGELLAKPYPSDYQDWMDRASPDSFKVSMIPIGE